ncbi:protein cereblon-like [Daphnia pulex]|uniref:protein cereblon-like n=1 Tax=Daphnia pulex TaxID=6669 RepID=UPI001EDE6DCE|nr:protein cereblon-like [Daphnia pulex]
MQCNTFYNPDDGGSFLDTASPFSLSVRNETIVYEQRATKVVKTVPVQKLKNPAGNVFDVVTLKNSSCKGVGKWVSDSTWFPGYSWKACVCNKCGRHLGWMFEVNSAVKGSLPTQPTKTGFYALIRDYILTESVAQTLTYVPKIFRE